MPSKRLPLDTLVTPAGKDDNHFLQDVKSKVYEIWGYEYINWELYYLVSPSLMDLEENKIIKLLHSEILYYDQEKWERMEPSDLQWDT